jgi:hypothetical protein
MGLLRTAVRTAVVADTATRVHCAVAARQQSRWAQQTAAPSLAPAPAPPPEAPVPAAPPPNRVRDTASVIAQLKELVQLRDAGILTDAEFQTQKDRLLQT